jgi:hypothetical protein
MARTAKQPSNKSYNFIQPVVWSNCNVENSYKYRCIFLEHRVNPLRWIVSFATVFPRHQAAIYSHPNHSLSTTQQSIFHQRFRPRHPLSNHPWIGTDRNQHSPAAKWRLPISGEPSNLSRSNYPAAVSGTFRLQRPIGLPESPRPVPCPISDKARSHLLCDLRSRYQSLDGLWPTAGCQGWIQPQKARTSFLSTASLLRGKNRRHLGRNLSFGRYPSCSSHYRCSGKKHLETSSWYPRDSDARRLGLLRPYDCRVSPRDSSLLSNCCPGHQADSAIFWRSFLRGDFCRPLVCRVRMQTLAMEYLSTIRRRATARPRKTFLATLAFQDGWIHLSSNCHQPLAETAESLAFLQPKSYGRTYHSRTPRSLYLGEDSHPRLGFKPSLFPYGPFGLQLDQLVQTPLLTRRLATVKSSNHPKSVALGASSIAPTSRPTDFKFTKQLSIFKNVYRGIEKHEETH